MKMAISCWIWALPLSACALGPTGHVTPNAVTAESSIAQREILTPSAGVVTSDFKAGDLVGQVAAAGKEGSNAPPRRADLETSVFASSNDHTQLAGGVPSPHPVALPMPLLELATGSLPAQRLSSELKSPPENGSLVPAAIARTEDGRRARSPTPEESQTKHLNGIQRTTAAMIQVSKQEYHRFESQCGCPEDIHFDGTACGERSAYLLRRPSRPLCYPSDVTPDMVADFMRTGSIIFSSR